MNVASGVARRTLELIRYCGDRATAYKNLKNDPVARRDNEAFRRLS